MQKRRPVEREWNRARARLVCVCERALLVVCALRLAFPKWGVMRAVRAVSGRERGPGPGPSIKS